MGVREWLGYLPAASYLHPARSARPCSTSCMAPFVHFIGAERAADTATTSATQSTLCRAENRKRSSRYDAHGAVGTGSATFLMIVHPEPSLRRATGPLLALRRLFLRTIQTLLRPEHFLAVQAQPSSLAAEAESRTVPRLATRTHAHSQLGIQNPESFPSCAAGIFQAIVIP